MLPPSPRAPEQILDGAPNFRPVGDLPAGDGRRLRPDVLYRSGECSALTSDDLAVIETLGIRLICDLRTDNERLQFPTRWPALAPARTIRLPESGDREAGMPALLARLAGEPGEAGARRAMLDLYAALPRLLAPVLQIQIDLLSRGWGAPSLIHCHVGKDRTGVAVAVLLRAVKVPVEAVFADYQASETHLDVERDYGALGLAITKLIGTRIDSDTLRILARADPDYLAASFAAIDRDYGSLEGYLQAIGVNRAGRETLEMRLLA